MIICHEHLLYKQISLYWYPGLLFVHILSVTHWNVTLWKYWIIYSFIFERDFSCWVFVKLYDFANLCHLIINSIWSTDVIWWHKSRSTLAWVMACCLMAPSHYLNQGWLLISKVPFITVSAQAINCIMNLKIILLKITATILRFQWVINNEISMYNIGLSPYFPFIGMLHEKVKSSIPWMVPNNIGSVKYLLN